MNAETFVEHFATFTNAPNGIEKLRGLILQLAIQGKLLPQVADDASAAAALLAQSDIAESNTVSELKRRTCSDVTTEIPWADTLPKCWAATTLDKVCSQITDGEHITPPRIPNGDVPLATAKNVRDGFMDLETTDFIGLETAEKCWRRCRPVQNDILMVCVGATTGRLTVLKETVPFVIVRSVALFRPILTLVIPEYLALLLRSPFGQEQIWRSVKQSAQPCLYISRSRQLTVPLPPLAEQRRIVEKVDQLLGLCDELAARQAAQREKRQRLVGATLDRLVSPQTSRHLACRGGLTASAPLDSDTTGAKANEPPGQARWRVMQDDAHRLRNHFDQLFDTPTTIPQLRQTILQLAVQGQLVPQDQNDEPAEDLLRRIVDEKKRLQEAGEFKLQDESVPIADKEKLFMIPPSWKWVRAADLSFPISSGSTPAKDVFQVTSENGVPYLKVYNIRNQKIDFEYCPQFIRKPHHDAKMKRSKLVPGMVVLNIVGPPLGKTAIVPPTFPEWNCNQAIAFFRFIGEVVPEYIHMYFCAGLFLRNIELIGTAGQDNISVTKCKNIVIPLPPFAEQKRIVTKVTELLSLCDALEAKLTQAESASTQLLSAAVHHLLQNP